MFRRLRRSAVWVLGPTTLAGTYLITVVTPASATTVVTDEASLRAAFSNAAETQIDLANSITLTDCGAGALSRASSTALTLDGHGFAITQSCTSGVMTQGGDGAVTLSDVTLTGGDNTGSGGGIYSAGGPLILTNASVSGNSAEPGGGGIYTHGPVTLTNSTVSDNVSGVAGGGIQAGGLVELVGSTVSGNTAQTVGGGIASNSATIINSTISGNTAIADFGGGIDVGPNFSTLTLVYATVVGNTAPALQAANATGYSLESFGSVVALPQGGGVNCNFPHSTSDGYNFSDDHFCDFTATTDKQDGGDPLLGPLANNGGSTLTRMPQLGSPLVDAIPTTSCQADGASGVTTDQRGVSRPQGVGCDIGSVEVSSSEEVASLVATVRSFDLPKGIGASLIAKLDEAEADLASGDMTDACGVLAAFTHEVQAQEGKKLTQEQADQLIATATQIRSAIPC